MKVFISHAHADAPLAAKLSEGLEQTGLEVWDPGRDLLPGDGAPEVARALEEALEESEAMVVLLTPHSINSPHVRREMEYALGAKNYSNRLIPVVVEGPESLPEQQIPWIGRKLRWFKLDRRGAAVQPIADEIRSPRPIPRQPTAVARRPNEVFLSHSSKDRSFVSRLVEVLRRHAIPVWYSETNITGAQQWHDEIGRALKRCDWFVLVLSPDAVGSKWVKRELVYSLQQDHFEERIAPLLYRPCSPEDLSWTLSAIQMVDFSSGCDQGCHDLLQVWGLGYEPD